MNATQIKDIVTNELGRPQQFSNFHGITKNNVSSFIVEPLAVLVDPDDLESSLRQMWIVLQLNSDPTTGYVVVYDSSTNSWGVAEYTQNGEYILVISADSLAGALNEM